MRAVVVTGIGCSGTSAVAGALHKMGCPMGHEGHLGRHPAGFGLYEDAEFYGAFSTKDEGRRMELGRLLLRHAREPVWGIKNTLAWKALDWLPEWFEALNWELCVVAVHRAVLDSMRGRCEGRCPPGAFYSQVEAERWMLQALHGYTGALLAIQAPTYHVQYEELIAHPERIVGSLASFVFHKLDATPDVDAGIAHIERRGK